MLEGSVIVSERWGSHELIPMYDAAGSVYGMIYDGEAYNFLRNLQGDVISVIDKNETTCANYSYDAWGKCTILSDTNGIADINPFGVPRVLLRQRDGIVSSNLTLLRPRNRTLYFA